MVSREAFELAMHRAPSVVKVAIAKARRERVDLIAILCWTVEYGRVLPERIDDLVNEWKRSHPINCELFE